MVKADFFVVELWWRLLGCPFTVSVCFAACMKDANPFLFFLLVGCGKSARWKACSFLIWNPWAESGLLPSEDYKSFGRGKKIIRLKMKNRLAENGKSFGADFFCCFPQRRGTVRQARPPISRRNGISWKAHTPSPPLRRPNKRYGAPNWCGATSIRPIHISVVQVCLCRCMDVRRCLQAVTKSYLRQLYFRFVWNIGTLFLPVLKVLLCTCHPV